MGKRVISALIFLLIGLVFIASAVYLGKILRKPRGVFIPVLQNTQEKVQVAPKGTEKQSGIIVTRVIDGDTVVISTGETVRYIGVDTPETVKPGTAVQCFGNEASAKNKELVLGKIVVLEKDVSETDKYSRLLRYIYVGDTFINDYLVRNGYASASTYPPDVKYSVQFKEAEAEARENRRGLWSDNACDTNSTNESLGEAVPHLTNLTPGCNIKGNINSKGEKIYHTPGQRYYDKTQIDEGAGEKMFCSEKDAQDSGWRRSKV